jgi:hypothetical protein
MATAEAQAGVQNYADGSIKTLRQSRTGELAKSDGHGAYWLTNRDQNVFFLTATNVTPSAFTGGAAGTPAISIYNPVGSGKNCVIIGGSIGSRTAGSVAGTAGFALFGGPSAAVSGTRTVASNMYSLQTGGSVTYGMVNTANTGSSATTLLLALGSYYWASAANANLAPLDFNVAGQIICPPGGLVALGATAVVTSATYDFTLIWEELPI